MTAQTDTAQTDAAPARATARIWVGLAVLALPTLLISIDVFVLILGLPHIAEATRANAAEQLWIMDIYSFMLAGFLITMGGLGDRIGRRRLLLIGAAAFAAASALAAFSTTPEMLIAARALLGIAGATITPSTLALITNVFTVPKERGLAVGIWMTCFMSGAIIGPMVGGFMLEHFWWGAIFLLGVPVMALLLILGPFFLPEFKAGGSGGINLASVGLSLLAILPFIFGLKEIARVGIQPIPVLSLVFGLAVAVAFVLRERRLSNPLLELRLFRIGAFTISTLGMLACSFTGTMMMFLAQYFQLVRELTPLQAALCMIPAAAASVIGMLGSPLLARRVRPAILMSAGLGLSVAGLVLLVVGLASGSLAMTIVAYAMWSLGSTPVVTLSTDIVMASVEPDKAGAAAGLVESTGEFGYAFGIALLGSVATFIYRLQLEGVPGVPDAAAESLSDAVRVSAELPTAEAAAMLDAAQSAFVSGVGVAAVCCAAMMAVIAVVVAVRLRSVRAYSEVTE